VLTELPRSTEVNVCVRARSCANLLVNLVYWNLYHHAVNSQELMGQVLDKLCTQTGLGWSSVPSGDEIFVTLSRQGVVVAMTPSVSHAFTRPPGTIAFVYRLTSGSGASMDSVVQFAGVDRC